MKKQTLLKFSKIGLATTFQDLGRVGYQHEGVPVSGAMDRFSLQIANLLAGNRRNEAAIEIIMGGVELTFLSDHMISITGGDLGAKLNDNAAPQWNSLKVKKGDILTFSGPRKGMIAYLAVSGGFEIKEEMGSKSSYPKADIGELPFNGGIIYSNTNMEQEKRIGLKKRYIPDLGLKEFYVDVLLGPDKDKFTEDSLSLFFNQSYVIKQISRMGIKLEGENELCYKNGSDVLSSPVSFGAIQVPANGQPIVLMADRQTTGGYGLIGLVSTSNISKLAQAQPGSIIRFQEVSLYEAQSRLIEDEKFLTRLEKELKDYRSSFK